MNCFENSESAVNDDEMKSDSKSKLIATTTVFGIALTLTGFVCQNIGGSRGLRWSGGAAQLLDLSRTAGPEIATVPFFGNTA